MSLSTGNVEQHLLHLRLSAYVGQQQIKRDLHTRIDVAKRNVQPLPHLLLCGPSEMGKATLAHVIALEMGVSIHSTSGLSIERIVDLATILTNRNPGDVLLIEQIELLRTPVLNSLSESIEDFKIPLEVHPEGKKRIFHLDLPQFTLIGTTSKPSLVDKILRRWLIVYDLVPYNLEQISELIQIFARQQRIMIDTDAAHMLAEYCDGSVGNARVLFKRVCQYSGNRTPVTVDVAREALISFRYLEPSVASVDLATKLRNMTGPAFEEFVAYVFREMGYVVEITQNSGDHGIDLYARKHDQLIIVQCKRWTAPVGEPVIREFFGSLMNVRAQRGYVVTTGSFTSHALAFAQDKPIQLIDLDALIDLVTHKQIRSHRGRLYE